MKLVVKNFGAIKESVIDLSRRYYFFVGYNNTGKTYLSKLIYDIFSKETLDHFPKTVYAQNIIHANQPTITLTESVIRSILDHFATFLQKNVIPNCFVVFENHPLFMQINGGRAFLSGLICLLAFF
jgi:recombinational DNA repair ATPase RecF